MKRRAAWAGCTVIRFELSEAPPSVNSQTRIGMVHSAKFGKKVPRKMKSKDYVAWCDKADREMAAQRGKLPDNCYFAAYVLIPGTSRIDLDNNLKGILDAVRRAGRIPDDRYCVDIRIRFHAKGHVVAAFTQEELSKWASIRQASKSTIQKLAKS